MFRDTRLGNASDHSRRCGVVKRTTYQIFRPSHVYVICYIRDGHITITRWNKRTESRNSVDLKDLLGKSAHLIDEFPAISVSDAWGQSANMEEVGSLDKGLQGKVEGFIIKG